MADDTLSQVAVFDRPTVKTSLEGQERFAMSMLFDESGARSAAGLVRELILLGLAERGWDEARRIEAYAGYRLRCVQSGEHNEFERE